MSTHGEARAKENPVLAGRVSNAEAARNIIRGVVAPKERPEPSAATRAAVAGRVGKAIGEARRPTPGRHETAPGARRRPGAHAKGAATRGANPTRAMARPLTPQEVRQHMLAINQTRPSSGEWGNRWEANRAHGNAAGDHAFRETRVAGNMRTKAPTATDRARAEGLTRQSHWANMTPEERQNALANSRVVAGQSSGRRATLTPQERDQLKYLRANRDRMQSEVAHFEQMRAHPQPTEDTMSDQRYANIMLGLLHRQLSTLQRLEDHQSAAKAAAKAARDAKLAPLRAHLSGLKAANDAAMVNDWLAQKYPALSPSLQRTYGEKPIPTTIARRIAASYATLQREFPSAATRIASLGINRSGEAPSGPGSLIHSTRGEGGGHAIGVSPALGRRGALKGAGGSVESMMRSAFAPAVQRDLQALPADSEGARAFAKWQAHYPGADFARAFTAIAYGRGSKGQRGAARSPEVRALKRALKVAYPTANLAQKPIRPTE